MSPTIHHVVVWFHGWHIELGQRTFSEGGKGMLTVQANSENVAGARELHVHVDFIFRFKRGQANKKMCLKYS